MERINLSELLKDCPKGMELDCVMYDKVILDGVDNSPIFPIRVRRQDGCLFTLTKYGQYCNSEYSKCVIFPKGKTTWEGFHRPFTDGDIVFYSDTIAIFKEWGDETLFRAHAYTYLGYEEYLCKEKPVFGKGIRKEVRFATEREKELLFRAIEDNGYRWNPETKTLDKLIRQKFKVGDRIRQKGEISTYTITDVNDAHYFCGKYVICDTCDDNWELVSNKFDINTLVPFESKVLARDTIKDKWYPGIWGYYDNDKDSTYPYKLIGNIARYCIPYEGNEHLLGTTDDCNEFYRTWEKTGD